MILMALIIGMILKRKSGPEARSIIDFGPKMILVENAVYLQGWNGDRPTFVESIEQAKQYFSPKEFLQDFERIKKMGFGLITAKDNNSTHETKIPSTEGHPGNNVPGQRPRPFL